jgi:excisionase family DNA binding protein
MNEVLEKLAFSVDEAALRANICRDAIYQAIRQNRLEAKKAGRRTLIPADALRRFIQELPTLNFRQPREQAQAAKNTATTKNNPNQMRD